MSSGAASSRIRPESRSSSQAALTISATTIREAMASARVKPVVRMMIPAMTVPMNPYRSVSTCRNAPWTFRLERSARASTQAAAMLTAIPAAATPRPGRRRRGAGG